MAKSLHATPKMEHSHESAKDHFHLIIIYLNSNKHLLKPKVTCLPGLPWFYGGPAQETPCLGLEEHFGVLCGGSGTPLKAPCRCEVGWERPCPGTATQHLLFSPPRRSRRRRAENSGDPKKIQETPKSRRPPNPSCSTSQRFATPLCWDLTPFFFSAPPSLFSPEQKDFVMC